MANVFPLSFCSSGSVFLQPTNSWRNKSSRRFYRPLKVPVIMSSSEGQPREQPYERELKLFRSSSGIVECSHLGCKPVFDENDFETLNDDFDNWVCVENVTDVVRSRIKAYHDKLRDQESLDSASKAKSFYKDFAIYLNKVWMQKELACKYYEKALAREASSAELLVEYAEFVWKSLRNTTMAEELLEEALDLQNDNVGVWGTYASLMWQAEECNAC
ncbi:hypothetical protein SUGI_0599730 [Cryptomeria japonica]|uniref:uncharacterized protein LOC131035132 n=1 Tax=Cryptomeria japonica TaxID=3369 RepID=UPI002414B799|nr:uncharacterized protein LOC131035132 [Cryptomeria japonica]GLJ30315.1 hypothetical protein SUGI_0599730 [Cryptomeria japonica]